MTDIEKLQQIIDNSNNIVFFGGAGVSTESGIPDFRSVDGLYNMKYKFPPEEIISHDFFFSKTEDFYDFYRDKILILDAQPNIAHKRLAQLEQAGKLSAVVTQNIDGLHQKAGSHTVYELHGSIHKNYCINCHKSFEPQFIKESDGIPRCTECGGIIKPDVVLYQEGLDDHTVAGALSAISEADTLIIAGTSLAVFPAAGFIKFFKGNHLVLINLTKTSADQKADLVIHKKVGQVLKEIKA